MGLLDDAPRVMERPHVCPTHGFCPYLGCPNATPGTHLVLFDPEAHTESLFVRVSRVEGDAIERAWSVTREWRLERCSEAQL